MGVPPQAGPSAPTDERIGARPVVPALELRLAMRSLMANMLGRVRDLEIGRYRIRERIGQGGCGMILLADDPELDREVAIKVVLPARERDASVSWQRALQREAQALAKLRHPNVVEVFDAGTAQYGTEEDSVDSGEPRIGVYVVMERLVGRTLRQWLAAKRRSWREIVDVHVQVAAGLRAAHEAGIVHRDFKPDNVLLTDDGRVVLIDFGLADDAHELDASDAELAASSASGRESETRQSRVVGTPAYMAPEQHSGHVIGPAADQYAWCVSLFAALHGAPPFRGDSMRELAAAKQRGRVPAPTAGPPRALHRVLRRGLAVDPSDRFASIDALLAAVSRATGTARVLPWALAASVAAVVTIGSIAGLQARHPCDATPLELEAVWTPQRRLEVAATLAKIPDPNAAALGDRVGERLDTHASRWRSAYDEVCASEASSTTVAARLECLDRSASRLGAVATAFTAMEADDLGHASTLLDGLRSPADCTRAHESAPEHRDELAALRRQADAMGTSIDATGTIDDEAAATQALARADELGDAELASTIAWRLSQFQRSAGRLDEAEENMRTAVFRAAAYDHARALELMPMLVLSVGSDRGDLAEAERLIEHAKLMAQHVDDPRHDLATLDNALAYILIEKNDPEGAARIYRRSLATFEAVGRPSSEYARALLALAGWAIEQRDLDAATQGLAKARALLDEVALPTDTNYAAIAFQQGGIAEKRGELEAAAAGYREAVDRLRQRLHGHPFIGVGLSAIAIVEARMGHFDVALAATREARALAVTAHGEAHPDSVRYTLFEAQISWLAGDARAARDVVARALAAIVDLPERDDDQVRGAHHLAGWIRVATGDLDGAAGHLTVLQSMPPGSGMYGIDLARSVRRLEAIIALANGEVARASTVLTRPTEGPTEPDEYDAELERHLDAAVWDRIVLRGGTRVPGALAPTPGYRPARDRAVSYAAFSSTFAAAITDGATLAAAR